LFSGLVVSVTIPLMDPSRAVDSMRQTLGEAAIQRQLDDVVVIVGVQPPEGERFCVISRDDMLRPFGIQCWTLLLEADLRDQLKQAGMSDSSIDSKFQFARQHTSTLICGTHAN
jgi:hypothetical protein